jgi:hypothetical protein
MKANKNTYNHIRSFEDFENEKIKLYYQIKLSEKKLEIKYIEMLAYLNPIKLVPALMTEWLSPLFGSIKDLIMGFFRQYTTPQNTGEKKSD